MLLLLRRTLLRKRIYESPPAEAVLRLHTMARKLIHGRDFSIPERLKEIAEKAAFSRLQIQEEERLEAARLYWALRQNVYVSLSRWRRPLFLLRFPRLQEKEFPKAP